MFPTHLGNLFIIHVVRERFASPYAILQRGPYSISLCRLIFPVDKIQRQKYKFSTCTHLAHYTTSVYAGCSTTTRVHRICARKSKLNVGFPCHDRRSLILGLPYTGNILTRPFSSILKAISGPIPSYGKGERIQL
jgi:hypothetical protein